MGCSSNDVENEKNPYEVNPDSFSKVEKIIKSYREAISKYKKYKEIYEDIFEQQIKCEKLLKHYFSIQNNIILANQPPEIKNYKKTFNRVNKLEDDLKIGPGFILKYKYNKSQKETENKNEEDNDNEEESEENENKKYKYKKKKMEKNKKKKK